MQYNLTFQFLYGWGSNIGEQNQKIYVIQNNSFTTPMNFSCSSSCNGCQSLYSNCSSCSPTSLFRRVNNITSSLSCLESCSLLEVPINNVCTSCETTTSYCSSCSSQNLTSCSSCQSGYQYNSAWDSCLDSSLSSKDSSRRTLSKQTPEWDDDFHFEQQMVRRIVQENMTQASGDSNSASLSALSASSLSNFFKNERWRIAWIVGGAAGACFGGKLVLALFSAIWRKSDSQRSHRKQRGQQSLKETIAELTVYQPAALLLFLLSCVEILQMPYVLLWAYSVSDGDIERPVLQSLIGTCSLSFILWIIDVSLLSSIFLDSRRTPISSSLFNLLAPQRRKEESASQKILLALTRGLCCLMPKSISILLSNLFAIEGWTSLPFKEGEERNAALLATMRKVFSSQIKSNVAGTIPFLLFLLLAYPDVMSTYLVVYDIILFNIVMVTLCAINIRSSEQALSFMNTIQIGS
uniref:MTAp n=1 Tax=Tetrahymena vorax TaxID=5919 RepID=A0A513X5A4_9HYMN|nr:MTAp [Tetrahymena vorax]